MELPEDTSDFLRLIYRSPNDDGAWGQMTQRLLELTGSKAILVSAVDTKNGSFTRTDLIGRLPSRIEEALEEYRCEAYRQDPSLEFALKNPSATFCNSITAIGAHDYLEHPFVRWNEDRIGAPFWFVGYTTPCEGMTLGISLLRSAEQGQISGREEELFRHVFPHIANSVRLSARICPIHSEQEPAFVLNAVGKVIGSNSQGSSLLASADGLVSIDGSLMPARKDQRRVFTRMLLDVLTGRIRSGAPAGLRVERPSGRRDLLAICEPLPTTAGVRGAFSPAALLRIVDPLDHRRASHAHRELFGLSEREMDVADLLLAGHSTGSLAAKLAISQGTAKIHLRSLFRKTGTSRQSELIDILVRAT